MNHEYPFCKRPLPADEPPIASWTCFLCGNFFPMSVDSTVQEVDGENRVLCVNCWEDYLKFLYGEAYLKARRRLEAAKKKKKAAEHG